MEVYLDNSATTPVSEGVAQVVMKAMTEDFGNPSSKHLKGMEAERLVRQAQEEIARAVSTRRSDIIGRIAIPSIRESASASGSSAW